MKRILFLIPYPLDEAPSQRFRFEQYFSAIEEAGFTYSTQSFLSLGNWRTFYNKGKIILKARVLIEGFLRRISVLFQLRDYDFIFVHREITPVGPPVFEWIIAKIIRKKIIYDFDDAIWMTDKTNETLVEKAIRWRFKVKGICKWSYKVSCGNEFLRSYAQKFNAKAFLNPTTIDTERIHNASLYLKETSNDKIIIGWTGSHSTLKYLKEIEPTLLKIEEKYGNTEFWVIADKPPEVNLRRLQFRLWSKETEIKDLRQFDIGLMPLPNDEWAKGKCGFKALQYMALQIPTVASPVGLNSTIINQGINGYLANSADDWEQILSKLIEDPQLRIRLGSEGKQTIDQRYSVNSNKKLFLSLFESE